MARPKKDIRSIRPIQVNVRMSVDEYLILSNNAGTLGIGIPDYVRRRATGKSLPRVKVLPENRKLFVELSRIGNNINQLVKKTHLGMHDPQGLQKELMELKGVLDAIKSNILGK
ncbi:MAG: plasmid mobilization relaxosome protein MobC [Muricauda sp. TMED12]|nr:MAG: plasmid mobilization relaxosome protein MobC [Muricauda sp. TMED12]